MALTPFTQFTSLDLARFWLQSSWSNALLRQSRRSIHGGYMQNNFIVAFILAALSLAACGTLHVKVDADYVPTGQPQSTTPPNDAAQPQTKKSS